MRIVVYALGCAHMRARVRPARRLANMIMAVAVLSAIDDDEYARNTQG